MTNGSMRGEKRQLASTRSRQARWEAKESLPAKLDLIIEELAIRDRVKGETVAIKMHTGNNLSYSTVHPVFVRKVVQVGTRMPRRGSAL